MKGFKFLFVLLFLYNTATAQTKDRLPCINKTFSIVVHILNDSTHQPGISEATVRSSLVALNKNFEPICVSFEICEFKYIENFSYNQFEEPKHWTELQQQYNVKNRINLYLVDKMVIPMGMAGFAGLGQIGSVLNGGVVIMKPQISTKVVLSHEMGHYFGLLHTFEGSGIELADGSNSKTEGDKIVDTPADPFVVNSTMSDYVDIATCRFVSKKKDAKGHFYDPIVVNIMSYYPENCSCGFTDQQYMKMAKTYLDNKGMW